MSTTVTPANLLPPPQPATRKLAHLREVIDHAGHFLPAQGPITVFVHHNTLHAFEDLPFHEAVKKGARIFGCQPYLAAGRYEGYLASGRIRSQDLAAELLDDLGDLADDLIGPFGTRYYLRLAMLEQPLRMAPTAELRWFVAETDALARFRDDVPPVARQRLINETRRWVMRDLHNNLAGTASQPGAAGNRAVRGALAGLLRHFDEASIDSWGDRTWEAFTLQALWRICREGVHGVKPRSAPSGPPQRHRDLLLQATGEDSDLLAHDILIRFCGAYLDQGFSAWPLPRRGEGFLRAFAALYGRRGSAPQWRRELADQLRQIEEHAVSPESCILESLEELGVPEGEWEPFVLSTLLALRGWAGMIRQMELRTDRAVHPVPAGTLVEFLAVRLLLDRLAVSHIARQAMQYQRPLRRLRHAARLALEKPPSASVEQRAFLVFQLAQVRGWLPADLHHLTKPQWSTLLTEIEAFSGLERRRIYHQAFERSYRIQALDAVSLNAAPQPAKLKPADFQMICCLDEREESFRRHVEELAPSSETLAAAGFFNVAMYYRGAADAHFVPLCPIVIRPQHWVEEDVVDTLEDVHRRRAKTRRALGTASHRLHLGSRTATGGALMAAGLGILASVPLVARVLFPRLTARFRQTLGRLVQPPRLTELQIERLQPAAGPEEGQLGFTLEERAGIGERLLRDLGLTSRFASHVLLLGHGSQSLNNPHNSAYNCGACGGGAGGPNARAAAQILNDANVRVELAARGLHIPPETVFIGGYHNTCNDTVSYFDLDRLPETHRVKFAEIQEVIERACDRNAHERCRRFQSAPLEMSFAAARRHVEERSEDLAQTRPECGHATNALCIVGRRERTRGLYLDRRAFLTSYDPTQDDEENTILTRLLQAAVPVCAGINLEYYFSYVDPTGWGCGTKLPHNVTSLLGVMDGAASDLRTGLPWQMVEIHEPVRLLFIVETAPERMLRIMDRNPAIGRLFRNDWVQLAVLSPDSEQIQLFRQGAFHRYRPEAEKLPVVNSSVDWYRGWRGHLGFASIQPATEGEPSTNGDGGVLYA